MPTALSTDALPRADDRAGLLLAQHIGGVADLPDDYGGDLDRVAVGVVDLRLRRFLVADPGRDRDAIGERVHPLQPGLADRAAVLAEQLDDAGLARRDGGQAAQHQGTGDKAKDAERYHRLRDAAMVVTCLYHQRHPGQQEDDAQHQHAQARQEPGRTLGHRLAGGRLAGSRLAGRRLVTGCAENLGCQLTHLA